MFTVLVTGGCGFVGSNTCIAIKKEFPNSTVYAFDNLKRRGSELNISKLNDLGIKFIHGDIRNSEDLESLDAVDFIIDAAAEPSVMAGIEGGHEQLININLLGTINLMNFALKRNSKFIFLSSSRIFPIEALNNIPFTQGETRFEISDSQSAEGISQNGIAESFTRDGARSYYGASKYCSELLMEEYQEFSGLQGIVNRCGVIAGPGQMGKVDQGFMVHWLTCHYWKQELKYFGFGGKGHQVRDVLHIDDLTDLIIMQLKNFDLFSNQVFNVGGGVTSSTSLSELSNLCAKVTGNTIDIKGVEDDRTADIRIYVTDHSKITALSNWKPKRNMEDIVVDIYNWLRNDEENLARIFKPKV